jgi:hypothetical protein
MSKLSKVTLLALAVASFSIFSNAAATKHVLQGTYINNGNYNADVPAATFTPIDTQLIVTCPGTTGTCTIEADMWVQNSNGTEATPNSICLYVDGVASGGCPFAGGATDPGYFETMTSSWPVSGLAPGEHTVQTFVYSTHGEFVGDHTSNYRVYKP